MIPEQLSFLSLPWPDMLQFHLNVFLLTEVVGKLVESIHHNVHLLCMESDAENSYLHKPLLIDNISVRASKFLDVSVTKL